MRRRCRCPACLRRCLGRNRDRRGAPLPHLIWKISSFFSLGDETSLLVGTTTLVFYMLSDSKPPPPPALPIRFILAANSLRAAICFWELLRPDERAFLANAANEECPKDAVRKSKSPLLIEVDPGLNYCLRRISLIRMWCLLHTESVEADAVLAINELLGMITAGEAAGWRGLLGLRNPAAAGGDETTRIPRPRWDRDAGVLYLGDTVIRKVRLRKDSGVVRILDRFEAERWPARIESGFDGRKAGETVYELHRRMQRGLRFYVLDRGRRVGWRMEPGPTPGESEFAGGD